MSNKLQWLRRLWQSLSRHDGVLSSQPLWVVLAILLICLGMALAAPQIRDSFFSLANFFNTSRSFAFMGIAALGMTAVIITGGIDLSVGSVMGLSAIAMGLVMSSGFSMPFGLLACLIVAGLCGLVNGILIAYLNLSAFVVTLGMMAIARSLALVVSNNQMIFQFGPDEELFLHLGGGASFYVSNPVWVLIGLTILFFFLFRYMRWGKYVFAIGGNAHAAKLNGVPVERILVSVYVVSALMAGLAAFLMVGWLGSVTNALGQNYELRVIAASVIGGANLAGGQGYAVGAAVGAALVEIIRNALLLLGVEPYWQGTFLGAFIILAVLLEKLRNKSGA